MAIAQRLANALRNVASFAGVYPEDAARADPEICYLLLSCDLHVVMGNPLGLQLADLLAISLERLCIEVGVLQVPGVEAGPLQVPAAVAEHARAALEAFAALQPEPDANLDRMLAAINPDDYTREELQVALQFTFSMLGARHRGQFNDGPMDPQWVEKLTDQVANDLPAMDKLARGYWGRLHFDQAAWLQQGCTDQPYEAWVETKIQPPRAPATRIGADLPL